MNKSPNERRLSRLNEDVLNMNTKSNPHFDSENIHNKIDQLDENLKLSNIQNELQFSNLAQQLNNINECSIFVFQSTTKKIEIGVQEIQNELKKQIENQQSQLKEIEIDIMNKGEIMFQDVKNILQQNQEIKIQEQKSIEEEIINQIQLTKQTIQDEKIERTETLIQKFGEEILSLQEILNEEKEKGQQKLQHIFDCVNNLDDEVFQEIQDERNEREKTEQIIYNLLEETINKIDNL